MRRSWMLRPWNRRAGVRVVRAAQAVGTDTERLLLVLFFVVFTIGTFLAIAEIVQAGTVLTP